MFERDEQHLPIPLGTLTPAHVRRVHRRRLSRYGQWMKYLVGAVCAAAGVTAALTAPPPSIGMANGVIKLDAQDLRPAGNTKAGAELFDGAAAFALRYGHGGLQTAAAVASIGGLRATGRCTERRIGAQTLADCSFTLGDSSVTAVDVLDLADHMWQRRYEDGITVTIDVPAGSTPVPLPLPLGR